MTRQELVSVTTKKLREQNERKPMRMDKHKFFISDENGNKAEFSISSKDTEILYNKRDVGIILDACLETIVDSIRRGEPVSITGFGSWGLHYRAARRTKSPGTDDWVEVDERYVPKFHFGNSLRLAARAYGLVKNDEESAPKNPDPIYDEDDY